MRVKNDLAKRGSLLTIDGVPNHVDAHLIVRNSVPETVRGKKYELVRLLCVEENI